MCEPKLRTPGMARTARLIAVTIRRSKADQEQEGPQVAVPYAQEPDRCVVRALRRYLDAKGQIVTELDTVEAVKVIDRIAASGVRSIAICLINSYVNPVHEELLASMITIWST